MRLKYVQYLLKYIRNVMLNNLNCSNVQYEKLELS